MRRPDRMAGLTAGGHWALIMIARTGEIPAMSDAESLRRYVPACSPTNWYSTSGVETEEMTVPLRVRLRR